MRERNIRPKIETKKRRADGQSAIKYPVEEVQLPRGITSKYVMLSVGYAQYLLDHHKFLGSNRNSSKSHVDALVRDLENGLWEWISGLFGPLVIGQNGAVYNAQHRCEAVIRAGIGIPIFQIEGVPERAVRFIDNGLPRRLRDFIEMAGATSRHARTVQATIYQTIRYCRGLGAGKSKHASIAEGWKFYCDNTKKLKRAVGQAMTDDRGLQRTTDMTSTFLRLIFECVSPEESELFFAGLRTDPVPGDNKAVHVLARILQAEIDASSSEKKFNQGARLGKLGMCINAWNLRKKRPVTEDDIVWDSSKGLPRISGFDAAKSGIKFLGD